MVAGIPSGRGDLLPGEGEKPAIRGVLGIVGSARRWGNSELLVRQVLRGAQSEGAAAQMLRLTDLRLESCTGCMRCAIGGKPCRLDDDMEWLIKILQAADGLVIAAPTYFLGPAAVVKKVLDRLLMVTGRVEDALPPPRPAVTIATAGLDGWRGVTLPYLNALVAAFGCRPIESLTAIAPGPGEVLLNEALMERVFLAGCRLGRGELEAAPALPNRCPICHCDAFALNGDRATCPICGREATVEIGEDGVRLRFDPAGGTHQRWTPEGLRCHMVEWVQATGPRFLARRDEIKARRRPYRAMEVGWLCPPPVEGK
jgi:NAD(P)H-dependent FMN reductase